MSLGNKSVEFFYHVLYYLILNHVHTKESILENRKEPGVEVVDPKEEKNFKNSALTMRQK